MENLPAAARTVITNSRARSIVGGLRRSGRTAMAPGLVTVVDDPAWLVVTGVRADRFYFVDRAGTRMLRGENLVDAYELQSGFTDAMARLGGAEKTVAAPVS
jgi:hypothetical protein